MFQPTYTDGDREILAELNADAYADFVDDWDSLSDEERDEILQAGRNELEIANAEAALTAARGKLAVAMEALGECYLTSTYEIYGADCYGEPLERKRAIACTNCGAEAKTADEIQHAPDCVFTALAASKAEAGGEGQDPQDRPRPPVHEVRAVRRHRVWARRAETRAGAIAHRTATSRFTRCSTRPSIISSAGSRTARRLRALRQSR